MWAWCEFVPGLILVGAPKAPSLEPPKPTGASLFGGSPLGGTALGASTLGASTLGTGVLSGPTLGAGALGGSTLGASALGATTAASVAPPSMLRGKTIEEIVNKWTSDLETHVGEFNKFASEVAAWDRALIENGNNVCNISISPRLPVLIPLSSPLSTAMCLQLNKNRALWTRLWTISSSNKRILLSHSTPTRKLARKSLVDKVAV